jgi:hypothetical protein
VQEAIAELGYSPNRAARNLRTRASHLIGMRISPAQEGTANAAMDRFVHSLVETSREAGYHVLLFAGDDEDPVGGYDDLLRSTAVDAFVVTDTYLGNPQAAWLEERWAPVRRIRPARGRSRTPAPLGRRRRPPRTGSPPSTCSSAATAGSPGSAGARLWIGEDRRLRVESARCTRAVLSTHRGSRPRVEGHRVERPRGQRRAPRRGRSRRRSVVRSDPWAWRAAHARRSAGCAPAATSRSSASTTPRVAHGRAARLTSVPPAARGTSPSRS